MPLKNLNNQCTATSKATGKRCPNPAVIGYNVCYAHGAHKKRSPNDPPRKTKSGRHSNVIRKYKNRIDGAAKELGVDLSAGLRHGFLAFEILSEEERKDFLGVVKQMHEDFKMNKSSDFYAVELVATDLVLYRRAAKSGDVKAAEAYDRMVRMHLSDLKATKSAREGETATVKTTPAEWAAALLARVDREEKAERAAGAGETGTERKNGVAFDAAEAEENRDVS